MEKESWHHHLDFAALHPMFKPVGRQLIFELVHLASGPSFGFLGVTMLRPLTRISTHRASQQFFRAGQRHERRNIGFAPPAQRPRSWKGSFARWGLAAGGVYWYMNSNVNLFDENANELGREFACCRRRSRGSLQIRDTDIGMEVLDVPQEAKLPTLETIAAARRERLAAAAPAEPSTQASPQADTSARDVSDPVPGGGDGTIPAAPGSPESLEEEAESQGAFNEETGEINWDCPCLGGMAHGPCGEQFREAFSCFVFSKEEPKGVDCIDRFK